MKICPFLLIDSQTKILAIIEVSFFGGRHLTFFPPLLSSLLWFSTTKYQARIAIYNWDVMISSPALKCK